MRREISAALIALLALGGCAPRGYVACPSRLPGTWHARDGSTLILRPGGSATAQLLRLIGDGRIVSTEGNWSEPKPNKTPGFWGSYWWNFDLALARVGDFPGAGLEMHLECEGDTATLFEWTGDPDTNERREFNKGS